jgi:type III secretion protein R
MTRKILVICFALLIVSGTVIGQDSVPEAATESSNSAVLVIVIAALAMAPFVLIMMTSYVKIAVVLSILRNAIGAPQVPPNHIITGIALILTIFIMAPVVEKMLSETGDVPQTEAIFSEASVKVIVDSSIKSKEPLRAFLKKYSHSKNRVLFFQLSQRMAKSNGNDPALIEQDDFRVIVPSFVTSQLTEAFQIGFFLFIPFLVIDLVVANILQAVGMFMLSPTVISLPFKLLLFVLIDGWVLLIQNLVLGYV